MYQGTCTLMYNNVFNKPSLNIIQGNIWQIINKST